MGSVLTACSSTDTFTDNEVEASSINTPIYLRGNFNTWEAQPEYQLKKISTDILQTKIKLSTAGQTYEFKISDALFSISSFNDLGFNTDISPPYDNIDLINSSEIFTFSSKV